MVNVDDMSEAINRIGTDASDELSPAIDTIVDNLVNKNMMPMDAIGMDHKTVEALYVQAVNFYNTAQYKEAARAFHALVVLDAIESKFHIGLGASYQMLGEYENALTVYGSIGIFDPENPVPHYHASDCYIKQDLIPAAIAEMQIAVELCGDQPQYAMMKDRCLVSIKSYQDKAKSK